jgi:hypothetical protein
MAAVSTGPDSSPNFYWRNLSGGPWHLEFIPGTVNDAQAPPEVIAVTDSAGAPLVVVATEATAGRVFLSAVMCPPDPAPVLPGPAALRHRNVLRLIPCTRQACGYAP